MENKLPAVTRQFLPFEGVRRFRRDFAAFMQAKDEQVVERVRVVEGSVTCGQCHLPYHAACGTCVAGGLVA